MLLLCTSPKAGDDHLGPRALRGPAGHLPAWYWLLLRSSRVAWAKQPPLTPYIHLYLSPFPGCHEEDHFSSLPAFSMGIHRAQKSGSPAVLYVQYVQYEGREVLSSSCFMLSIRTVCNPGCLKA